MSFNSKFKIKNSKFGGWTALIFLLHGVLSAQNPVQATAASPHRIISLSPNITEMIYDMGAQDLLVGDTVYCKFPPGAETKEKVGGWVNPSFEKIVSLKPDLVLALKLYGKNEETFRKLGIPVVVLDCITVEDILDSYDTIGRALGRAAAAQKARRRFEKDLENLRNLAKGRKPLSVLFVIGRNPGTLEQIYGVGPHNFIDELVGWNGGMNILSDSPVPYPIVSKEQLLKRNPDVIIEALPTSEVKPERFEKEKAVWKQLSALKAVQKGNVYCFNNSDYVVPGPSMVKLARYLSDIFAKVRTQK